MIYISLWTHHNGLFCTRKLLLKGAIVLFWLIMNELWTLPVWNQNWWERWINAYERLRETVAICYASVNLFDSRDFEKNSYLKLYVQKSLFVKGLGMSLESKSLSSVRYILDLDNDTSKHWKALLDFGHLSFNCSPDNPNWRCRRHLWNRCNFEPKGYEIGRPFVTTKWM